MAETFGIRLRILRGQRGYSQDAMAEFLDVSQSVYSCWELDKVDIPASRLTKIATFFDVTADWLLFGDRESSPVETATKEPVHV